MPDSDSDNDETNGTAEPANNGMSMNLDDMDSENIEAALKGLVLPQFDPTTIKKDALCMVVGKRRFGKSVFCQWCISHLAKYYPDGIYVFTTTKHNWFWQQHCPDSRVYPGFDWGIIEMLKQGQLEKWERRKKTGEKSLDTILLIFDDCISARHDARYAEELLALVFNGRHYMMSIWLLTQDIKGFFPDVRANVDYAMLTYQIQTRQTKTLRDDFADFFPNRETFAELLRRETQDFQLLIIDQSTAKYSLNDGVFSVAKAEEFPPPFRVGDAQFWKESGCDWDEQVATWNNIKNSILEDSDYDQLAEQRAKESDELEKMEKLRKEENESFRTAAWTAAPLEKQEEILAARRPKYMNWVSKEMEEFDNDLKEMYIATEKGYIKTVPRDLKPTVIPKKIKKPFG